MTSDFILGVDLDGVCADYTSGLSRVVELDRGLKFGSLPPPNSWNFDNRGEDFDFMKYHEMLVVRDRGFRVLKPIDGVSDALWKLSEAGVWIRIITHRFVIKGNNALITEDTTYWLDANNIPYRDICFLGSKVDVHADLYVDDGPHNIEALRAAGAETVVFDQPYNQHCEGPRVRTHSELTDFVFNVKGGLKCS